MIVIHTHRNQTPTTKTVPTLHEPKTAQLMLWYAHLRTSFYLAFVFVLRLSFTLSKRTKTNEKKFQRIISREGIDDFIAKDKGRKWRRPRYMYPTINQQGIGGRSIQRMKICKHN